MYATLSVLFLCVNVVCAVLGQRGEDGGRTWSLVLVRVLVNDLLFILEAICLAGLLLVLARRSPTTNLYLHSKVGPESRLKKEDYTKGLMYVASRVICICTIVIQIDILDTRGTAQSTQR